VVKRQNSNRAGPSHERPPSSGKNKRQFIGFIPKNPTDLELEQIVEEIKKAAKESEAEGEQRGRNRDASMVTFDGSLD
jgi:hypothetical protein